MHPAGLRAGTPWPAATRSGTAGPGRLWVQVSADADIAVPAFVRPEYAPGWLTLTRDPAPLLGLAPAAPAAEDAAALVAPPRPVLRRRAGALLPAIRRGSSAAGAVPAVDADGRSYVDMVNNVAAIGHGHPRLADAVARQWRLLNTNSRFHYSAVADFSERLAATLPEPLDTVFLVNRGSEAVDLALRLAMAATGRRDVVAVREAYHGWTYATDAVSTSVADNPNALTTRPDWVHTVPQPEQPSGASTAATTRRRYAPEAVAIIEALAAQGHPPAAFICEPFYGNAGGIALPDGYLAAVYDAVRAAGGLAIADEVQVGYGRLGSWFWGFQQQGVVPDIVTVAKAMGNGQPLGAVITTRAIADAYRSQGYFFSSAGGSPVSCVVGLTVLDVIETRGCSRTPLTSATHLRTRLTELADRHPIIGAVHGSGLYLGVELVRDRADAGAGRRRDGGDLRADARARGHRAADRRPAERAEDEAADVPVDREAADFFVDMLDRVLTTGW